MPRPPRILELLMGLSVILCAIMSFRSGTPERALAGILQLTVGGLLMVSRVPYRSPASLRLSRETMTLLALGCGVVLAIAVKYRFPTAFITVLGAYVLSGPIEAMVRRRRVEVLPDEDLIEPEEEPIEEQISRH